ncbi:LuxR family transcriptional regulator [Paraburkholderia phenazinium]|jgi:DNA-binding CsgD family transcriptional regulator|uniref:LuxR family transcriptional regulator n=1 Tax=Paraburkholderia phenazinium TaxID=60549 RepID=A0A1G8M3A2_9BURK|nr:LuxR family transcriptional regulator [Paraburkholderia phenazinium]
MHMWRETYLDLFASTRSEADIFRKLSFAVRELGFEYCAFGTCVPFPISNPRFTLQSDYPDAWEDRYVSSNYFAVDPTVRHSLTQSMPLVWQADGQTQNLEFWEEAAHHGLRYGWSMPTIARNGPVGLVSMVRSGEPIDPLELVSKEYRMLWLVNAVSGAMQADFAARYAVELTSREREALRWSASGKTYVEIGMIMSVDERTVKFHLVNTMRKLNAMNKTEAAVKAAMLGLLW